MNEATLPISLFRLVVLSLSRPFLGRGHTTQKTLFLAQDGFAPTLPFRHIRRRFRGHPPLRFPTPHPPGRKVGIEEPDSE